MNREIKFRAWDKDEKIMKGENDSTWALHNKMYEPYDQSRILMQYTGLKDKNGKEIYEGDIVNISNFEPSVYQVGFNRGGFCIFKNPNDDYYTDIKYVDRGEIIGNIYENPNLINK